jgi:hypothetical protein
LPVVRRQDFEQANALLFYPPPPPFAQRDWPNPVPRVFRLQDWQQAAQAPFIPAQPFPVGRQLDWPNPVLPVVRRADWVEGSAALYIPAAAAIATTPNRGFMANVNELINIREYG